MTPLEALRDCLAELRAKAAELRESFACDGPASALDWASDRLEKALRNAQDEVLSLAEASSRSGYSQEHLARLVRTGRIPDLRPPGSKARIFIRASDLPARPASPHTEGADVHELASRLLGGREGLHGHP